jgi:hypothetical protein
MNNNKKKKIKLFYKIDAKVINHLFWLKIKMSIYNLAYIQNYFYQMK